MDITCRQDEVDDCSLTLRQPITVVVRGEFNRVHSIHEQLSMNPMSEDNRKKNQNPGSDQLSYSASYNRPIRLDLDSNKEFAILNSSWQLDHLTFLISELSEVNLRSYLAYFCNLARVERQKYERKDGEDGVVVEQVVLTQFLFEKTS